MAETSTPKKILLKSSDDEEFIVDEIVALKSQTIKHMIEDDCADNIIPLPNVTAKILAKVIEYCKKHVEAAAAKTVDTTTASTSTAAAAVGHDDELKKWDEEFVKVVDQNTLFDLILAANYLNIQDLLDLTCQAAADMIKDMMPEEVRKSSTLSTTSHPKKKKRFEGRISGPLNDRLSFHSLPYLYHPRLIRAT